MEKFSTDSGVTTPSALKDLHMIARLCNEATFEGKDASLPVEQRSIQGNATDAAVLRFAESLTLPTIDVDSNKLVASYDKLFDIPFNSRNKWMLSIVREKATPDQDPWMLIKGAPDVLFPLCASVLQADGTTLSINSTVKQQLKSLQDNWSRQGQRVIALCKKQMPAAKIDDPNLSANDIEELVYDKLNNLTLVGMLSIFDPPRHNAKDTIGVIKRAGIRVFMVTGDFALTAISIAKRVRTSHPLTPLVILSVL
jgi:sodium/potassium-transporting ATPase subunit alpha